MIGDRLNPRGTNVMSFDRDELDMLIAWSAAACRAQGGNARWFGAARVLQDKLIVMRDAEIVAFLASVEEPDVLGAIGDLDGQGSDW